MKRLGFGDHGDVYADPDGTSVWKVEEPRKVFDGPRQACLASEKKVGPPFLDAFRVLVGDTSQTLYATRTRRLAVTLKKELLRARRDDGYKNWESLDACVADLVKRLMGAMPLCHLDCELQNVMLEKDDAGNIEKAYLIDWDGEHAFADTWCAHVPNDGEAFVHSGPDKSTFEMLKRQIRKTVDVSRFPKTFALLKEAIREFPARRVVVSEEDGLRYVSYHEFTPEELREMYPPTLLL